MLDARAPFVARAAEMNTLRGSLDAACAGQGAIALVAGDAGIGKTRLVAAEAAARGAVAVWGRCWESEGAPPYWPWVEVLRTLIQRGDPATIQAYLGPGAADVAQLVPLVSVRLGPVDPPPPSHPETARYRLFESVSSFLSAVAAREPLLLLLDDLHWADVPSLLLLRYLAWSVRPIRLLVVGAFRDADLDRQHPLVRTVGSLGRDAGVPTLRLDGLPSAAIGEMIERATNRPASTELVTALHRQTDGNPLFVTEALRLLQAEGATG